MPMEVVDEDGSLSTDPEVVLRRWKRDFQSIYNPDAGGAFDQGRLEELQQQVRTMEEDYRQLTGEPYVNDPHIPQTDVDELNASVSLGEVRAAVTHAKLRKATGVDQIPSEVLKNETVIRLLHKLIDYCFRNGVIPDQWLKSVINPIFKSGSKDVRDPLQYRGISLLCTTYKVYCSVLNARLTRWLDQNDKLADEQNGFRKARSCLDHIFTLNAIVQNRLLTNQDTFSCFIDAKKAFDSLNRDCLWFKMLSLGIRGHFYHAVKSLYSDVSCAVRLNGQLSDWFSVECGVKQGCPLSPTLFSIYINDFENELKDLGLGVNSDGVQVPLLMYADDVVLMAPNAHNLQLMLNHVDDWCSRWRLKINQEKTKVIHFRKCSKPSTDYKFKIGDLEIDLIDKYKYLGLWFHEHLDLRETTKLLAQSGTRAMGKMFCKFKQCGYSVYSCFTKLFDSCVLPVCMYSAGVWGHKEYSMLNTVQNKACRFFMCVPAQSPNAGTQGEMGWLSMLSKSKLEVARLWCRLKNMEVGRLTKHIFTWSSNMANNRCRNWVYSTRAMFEQLDLGDTPYGEAIGTRPFLRNVSAKLAQQDSAVWHQALWNDRNNRVNGNKLRTYRLFKDTLEVEPYLLLNQHRLQRRSLAMLRIGVLPLEVETGRYARPATPLDERLCQLCTLNVVEDEKHFMLQCPLYEDQRQSMLQRASVLNEHFNSLNYVDKMTYLMKEHELQGCLAKTVTNMYNRRNIFKRK